MNAIKYIKDHGVDKAREVVEGAPTLDCDFDPYDSSYMSQVHQHEWEMWKEDIKRWDVCEWDVDVSDYILVSDLKRLVESVDLIKKHGGLFSTKCQLDKGGSHYEWYGENGDYGLTDLEDLEQANADYEQLFGNTETLELETLRDCDTSPNCKKFDERVK